ncbi:MAG: amidohydrolase family protein [Armatimonadota bacterium]|nr:amidohydrolase family protein [Armatimonadota bacterium]
MFPSWCTTTHRRRVSCGQLTLTKLVQLTRENPARLFGLWPQKGSLRPGADSNLVLVDLSAQSVHDSSKLQTKARGATLIYDGMRFQGLAVATFVRGRVVMRGGEVVGPPGWGALDPT